jgi:septal ring factor EnvC (AmiA/AmiB activator)
MSIKADISVAIKKDKIFLETKIFLLVVRGEIERRLQEKDEEFEGVRQNHHRIVESMQASLDAEIKSKSECIRQKKKLEGDINQLEMSLGNATKQLSDLQKVNKKLQQNVSELNGQIEDEQNQKVSCFN